MKDDSITSDDIQQNADETIFESQFHALTDGFGQACEENKVDIAFAFAMHPDNDKPIIFAKGHRYDVAVWLNKILNSIKSQIADELDLG